MVRISRLRRTVAVVAVAAAVVVTVGLPAPGASAGVASAPAMFGACAPSAVPGCHLVALQDNAAGVAARLGVSLPLRKLADLLRERYPHEPEDLDPIFATARTFLRGFPEYPVTKSGSDGRSLPRPTENMIHDGYAENHGQIDLQFGYRGYVPVPTAAANTHAVEKTFTSLAYLYDCRPARCRTQRIPSRNQQDQSSSCVVRRRDVREGQRYLALCLPGHRPGWAGHRRARLGEAGCGNQSPIRPTSVDRRGVPAREVERTSR
jgi:hypothetical protein